MTLPASLASPCVTVLRAAASAAGLRVLSSASWPETSADQEVSPLAGFIDSSFSPLIAEVAGRLLRRLGRQEAAGGRTAIVIVTERGDVASATRVASAVDAGARVGPLHFFQSVPNAVAGHLAARWNLTGPVVCVGGPQAALDIAALLLADADAEEVLVVQIEQAVTEDERDRAAALLLTGEVTAGPDEPASA